FDLAQMADARGESFLKIVRERATGETLDYEAVYSGRSEWKLLAPIDHPIESARCLITGTGLTHLGGAKNRQAMHSAGAAEESDSMKIFRLGVAGGKPAPGQIGAPPEWFYKGTGAILRACGQPLEVPFYGEDGGEEAEIAGVYLIGADGAPRR